MQILPKYSSLLNNVLILHYNSWSLKLTMMRDLKEECKHTPDINIAHMLINLLFPFKLALIITLQRWGLTFYCKIASFYKTGLIVTCCQYFLFTSVSKHPVAFT
jgi:hypothetical protein